MLKVLDGFGKYGYINLHAIERIEYQEGGYRSFYSPMMNYHACKDHSQIVGWPWNRRRVRASSYWNRPRITLIMASGNYLWHYGTRKDKSKKIHDDLVKTLKDLNGSCLYRSHGDGPERS